ncbi:MAG: MFS transporter [Bacteroidales bacterium]|nr:MFS transporter [Bacteroidales bacterium]
MRKPKLSFGQIWNLSFGFLGVQIGYSLQNSNTSSIFQSLGADVSHLSYFWLAAPIAGLVIQPIIGMFSDGTWTRFGRRIPYILGGSLISTAALLLMPNCPKLLAFAPLAMGAFLLLFMDLSFNVTMQPFRALVSDMLDDSQKTRGYVVQTFLINLGAVIGALLPLIMTWCGVSDEVIPGKVPHHIAYSYYVGGIILLATVLVTVFRVKEYPPKEFEQYNRPDDEPAQTEGATAETTTAETTIAAQPTAETTAVTAPAEPAGKQNFWQILKTTPKVMLQLGVVQFFSWAALFMMWTYLKPAITGVVTDPSGAILSEGATQTWTGVLNAVYPIPACIVSLFMAQIAAKWGNKPTYAVCLLFGAVGFVCLTFLHNQYALMAPMVGIGIAWAGILAMPYSILSVALDAKKTGVYMGIFNFTVTIPQIVMGLIGGWLLTHLCGGNPHHMLRLAGLFMLLAALAVIFVKEKRHEA